MVEAGLLPESHVLLSQRQLPKLIREQPAGITVLRAFYRCSNVDMAIIYLSPSPTKDLGRMQPCQTAPGSLSLLAEVPGTVRHLDLGSPQLKDVHLVFLLGLCSCPHLRLLF